MRTAKPTGYLRVREAGNGFRKPGQQPREGDTWYAKLKLPDGSQPQRSLGRVWTKRSRPPAGYLTRDMAAARLAAILAGDDALVNVAPSHVTFKQACDEHLRYLEHDRRRKASYLRDCRGIVNRYLLPRLGESSAVEEVTTDAVNELSAELLSDGLAPKTVQNAQTLLYGIMARAQRKGWTDANPCDHAEKVTVKRSGDFNVLSVEQVYLVSDAALDELRASIIRVAAFTGLRMGELRALRWRNVDFVNRILHVRRNLACGNVEEDTPKSGVVRSVPLDDSAAGALNDVSRREQFTGPDDLVFCDAAGQHLPDAYLRDGFYDALDAAGLAHLRSTDNPNGPMWFHDLRHTFGTLAVREAPVTDVQHWMGHADVQTTMRYVHYIPQADNAAKLSAAFARPAPALAVAA
jgi:integrase